MTASSSRADVIVRPLITEKAAAARADGVYAFEVRREASKPEIARAVEEAFKVKVTAVRTMNRTGKRKRLRTAAYGRTPDWKKAVVTLKEGQRIDVL